MTTPKPAVLECSHGLCHTVVTDGVNGRFEQEDDDEGGTYFTALCDSCYADDHRDDQALIDAESGAAMERYLDDRHHRLYGE